MTPKETASRKRSAAERHLLFAIGNDGRGDDGLGWAFARRVEDLWPQGRVMFRFQLQVEDAELIRDADSVLFVDASMEDGIDQVTFRPCEPAPVLSHSSHKMEPAAVLQLCEEVYGKSPPAYVLLLPGYQWDLGQGLSPQAEAQLEKAWQMWQGESALANWKRSAIDPQMA